MAFFDLAYPKGCAELASMHAHAVLVVTAVVQDSTELPPARTYVRGAAHDTALVRVVGVESRVASADVRATFGPFRADVLYLLPVQLSVGAGDVLLDFAAHRQAFRVMHLSGRLPEALTACGVAAAAAQAPPDSVFWSLVHREYPDLWGILVRHTEPPQGAGVSRRGGSNT